MKQIWNFLTHKVSVFIYGLFIGVATMWVIVAAALLGAREVTTNMGLTYLCIPTMRDR